MATILSASATISLTGTAKTILTIQMDSGAVITKTVSQNLLNTPSKVTQYLHILESLSAGLIIPPSGLNPRNLAGISG